MNDVMQGHWTLLHEIGLVWQKHVALSFSYTAVFFLQLHQYSDRQRFFYGTFPFSYTFKLLPGSPSCQGDWEPL